MFVLPVAVDLVREAVAREALSGRPDAPVVPVVAGRTAAPRSHRARLRLSGVLQRAADSVAPAECSPAQCSPVR